MNIINVNASPTMFHVYALHYFECNQAFVNRHPFSPVPYFLLCRAIELELKSRHLESKSRKQVKKDYGHNLTKSYDALDPSEKILDMSEYAELVKASRIYDVPKKGFEYCSVYDAATGFKSFPALAVLDQIARRLLGADAQQVVPSTTPQSGAA